MNLPEKLRFTSTFMEILSRVFEILELNNFLQNLRSMFIGNNNNSNNYLIFFFFLYLFIHLFTPRRLGP